MTATVSTTATAGGAAANGTATGTFGVRLRWAAAAVPAFTVGWVSAQAMGEVVGEAWGGDFPHALGHTVGTVVVVGLVSVAGWLVLRDRVRWASRWALAGTAGSVVGLVLYMPILAAAPDAMAGLTIALTLHLPLLMAATFQAGALRSHLRQPRQWALAWFVGIVLGVAVAWFAGGGLDGASAGSVHPVLPRALEHWWRMLPSSALGAVLFALWTAWTVPLDRAISSDPDQPGRNFGGRSHGAVAVSRLVGPHAAALSAPGARTLLAMGADVSARNRRGAQPLHYAADGVPGSDAWSPAAQAPLIAAGADPNATDKSGVAPLHRAVRTRCSEAVRALFDGGADPKRTNKSGSTPMTLATRATGRGGSGSTEAKAQQAAIVKLLERYGGTP